MVRLRGEESPRKSLRAARKSLTRALATVDRALADLGGEATPTVKNTFLEFLPQRTTRPRRKTCGARFADVTEEDDEDDEDDGEASPHEFPVEYDNWPATPPTPVRMPPAMPRPMPQMAPVVSPQQLLTTNAQMVQELF